VGYALGGCGPDGKPSAEAKAHQQTITVKPAANGCTVARSTKVSKALGTPEGLNSAMQEERGRELRRSSIACQCGATAESKDCGQGEICTCGSGETPAVICN